MTVRSSLLWFILFPLLYLDVNKHSNIVEHIKIDFIGAVSGCAENAESHWPQVHITLKVL